MYTWEEIEEHVNSSLSSLPDQEASGDGAGRS